MPSAGIPSAFWSATTVLPDERTTFAPEPGPAAVAPPAASVSDAIATATRLRRPRRRRRRWAASRRRVRERRRDSRQREVSHSVVGTARTPQVSAPTGLAVGLARRPALRRTERGDSPPEPDRPAPTGSPAPHRLGDGDSARSGCVEAEHYTHRLTPMIGGAPRNLQRKGARWRKDGTISGSASAASNPARWSSARSRG